MKTYLQQCDLYNIKVDQPRIDFLKSVTEDALLVSAGSLFHSLAHIKKSSFSHLLTFALVASNQTRSSEGTR